MQRPQDLIMIASLDAAKPLSLRAGAFVPGKVWAALFSGLCLEFARTRVCLIIQSLCIPQLRRIAQERFLEK